MSSETLKPTGKQLKKALIDLDLSYIELAKAMGCSVYYIREIAADTRKATEMRKRIAQWIAEKYRHMGIKDVPRWAA